MSVRTWPVVILIVTMFTIALDKSIPVAVQSQVSTPFPTRQSPLTSSITSANAHLIVQRDVWKIDGVPVSLAFSRDGEILAVGLGHNAIQLWNTVSRSEIAILEGHTADAINSVIFSPDGTLLASASQDRTVRLWDLNTDSEKFVLKGHTGDVKNLAFSSDGKFLASSGDIEAILWDVTTGSQKAILKSGAENTPYLVAFSPTGSLLAVASYGGVDLWDVTTSKPEEMLECPGKPDDIEFSSNNNLFACVTSSGFVYIWDLIVNKQLATFQVEGGAKSMVFDPPGKNLAVVGSGTLSLWDITAQKLMPLSNHGCNFISNAVFNLDGSILAYGGYCAKEEIGFIEMDDVATGKELVRQKTEGLIWNVLFNPNSTLFVSAEGGRLTTWGLH